MFARYNNTIMGRGGGQMVIVRGFYSNELLK